MAAAVPTSADWANAIAGQARSHGQKLGLLVVAFGQVLVLELDVVAGAVGEERVFLFAQQSHLFHWAAHVQVPAGQALARGHQAAGTDDHLVLDDGAIHDGAAHAHQDAVAQGTAMQHDFVTDGHLVADDQRETIRVEGPGVGDVQHAAILHAGARADADAVHVAAHHRQWPDRAVVTDLDVADDHRRTVDEGPCSHFRRVFLEGPEGHDSVPLQCR